MPRSYPVTHVDPAEGVRKRPIVGRVYRITRQTKQRDKVTHYRIDAQPSVDRYAITSYAPESLHKPTKHYGNVLWSSLRVRHLVEVVGDDIPDELWTGAPRKRQRLIARLVETAPLTAQTLAAAKGYLESKAQKPAPLVHVTFNGHVIKDLLEDIYSGESQVPVNQALRFANDLIWLGQQILSDVVSLPADGKGKAAE